MFSGLCVLDIREVDPDFEGIAFVVADSELMKAARVIGLDGEKESVRVEGGESEEGDGEEAVHSFLLLNNYIFDWLGCNKRR